MYYTVKMPYSQKMKESEDVFLFQVTYDGNVTLLTQAIYLSKCTIGRVSPPFPSYCCPKSMSIEQYFLKIALMKKTKFGL